MTLTDMEQAVLDQLELLVRQGKDVEEAAARLGRMGVDAGLLRRVVEARAEIARRQRKLAFNDGALIDPQMRPAWYTGPAEDDIFWPRLRSVLEQDPGWADAVPSLDTSSTDVVGLLADPHSPVIGTRGLVLGYVQSGKTANFTATIAKAADAGYRMFIVLSGVHNSLRRQTQLRLERQLADLQPKHWLTLTDEHRDFGNPVKALAIMARTDLRLLAVVKKNVSRLTRLRDWLRQADEHGGLDTCPVLIIDDEADQASPNAARNPELDRTKINQRIIELGALQRVGYVGYTATPFANMLIDPASPKDLYPRDFIYSLSKPKDYFGAEELFGLGKSEEEQEEGHDVIRFMDADEAAKHTIHGNAAFSAEITPSLRTAVLWFVLATAARRQRSGKSPHSSMLIHTTQRVAPQFEYLQPIRDLLRSTRAGLDRGDLIKELTELWYEEQDREPPQRYGLEPIQFDKLLPLIPDVISDTKVVADNGQSAERLLYDDSAGTTVIAVGGNTLSRGLTLEGLVSSVFLRGASTYDTLLQMGRWFGYRPGYGDLPRIWTTGDLADNFRFLADVERDLRAEIDRYRVEGTTPAEVAIRIRLHPKMQVTSRVRMRFAVPVVASFSGQRPQTTLFHHRDSAEALSNRQATTALITAALSGGSTLKEEPSRLILSDVPAAAMLQFLDSYAFHPDSELAPPLLTAYVRKQIENGELLTWNLAVITQEQNVAGTMDLGLPKEVPLIERSRLAKFSNSTTANIGSLMSKPDRVADLMGPKQARAKTETELVEERTASGRGLLLIYPIAASSPPRYDTSQREPLDASEDLVGVAIAFPRAPEETDQSSWIQVDPARLPTAPVDEFVAEVEYADDEGDRDDVDLGDG